MRIMNSKSKRTIKFSPSDITEIEIDEVVDTLKSGWITTGDIEFLGICPYRLPFIDESEIVPILG